MTLDKLNPKINAASIYDRRNARGKKSERVSYDAMLVYVFSGDISATVSGKKLGHLASGTLLYIPAGCAFTLKAQYLRAALISFAPLSKEHEPLAPTSPEQFKPELSCSCPAPFDKVIRLDEFESVWEDVERITELYLAGDEYSLAKAAALLKLLLVKIAEASDESALPLRMTETLDQYIRDHAGEEISNTEVGAIFGYHPFYVSTVIKEKRGITLRQYVISYRLKLARNMLEHTDKTIAEIAEETGFTDASYFTKSFKAAFDETPKEWRAKFKEDVL